MINEVGRTVSNGTSVVLQSIHVFGRLQEARVSSLVDDFQDLELQRVEQFGPELEVLPLQHLINVALEFLWHLQLEFFHIAIKYSPDECFHRSARLVFLNPQSLAQKVELVAFLVDRIHQVLQVSLEQVSAFFVLGQVLERQRPQLVGRRRCR